MLFFQWNYKTEHVVHSFVISKQIKLEYPALSHKKDILQSFQTIMDFLCFKNLVKQKLKKNQMRGEGNQRPGGRENPKAAKHP